MLTIGEVALKSGLRASAIRYYESLGLLPAPARKAGKRIYADSIVQRLAVIELAKVAGFGLHEIRSLVSDAAAGEPVRSWRKQASAKRAEIDRQMRHLLRMKRILARLAACRCATLEQCGQVFLETRARRRNPL
jgi:MerR family redox-sensitive transcriptional activator SoxR